MATKNQPVKEIRFGRIKAVIWRNPGTNGNGPMFNTTLARLYKDPESLSDAIAIMRREQGKHFDPDLFDRFVGLANELYEEVQDDQKTPKEYEESIEHILALLGQEVHLHSKRELIERFINGLASIASSRPHRTLPLMTAG